MYLHTHLHMHLYIHSLLHVHIYDRQVLLSVNVVPISARLAIFLSVEFDFGVLVIMIEVLTPYSLLYIRIHYVGTIALL